MKKIILITVLAILTLSCSKEGGIDGMATEGQGGSLATFILKGDYLYVVDEYDLNVFSILDNGNPVFVNKVRIGFNIETLFGFKDYLYVGSRDGMYIYSLDNPEFPEQLSSVQHFTACDPVVANDNYAYVTLHSNTRCGNNINLLEIYDISELTQPKLISSRNLIYPKGLGLFGDYLLVCDDEVKIFDVSDPTNSKLMNSINKEAFDLIVRGDKLIVIGNNGLYQYKLQITEEGIDYSILSIIDFIPSYNVDTDIVL